MTHATPPNVHCIHCNEVIVKQENKLWYHVFRSQNDNGDTWSTLDIECREKL